MKITYWHAGFSYRCLSGTLNSSARPLYLSFAPLELESCNGVPSTLIIHVFHETPCFFTDFKQNRNNPTSACLTALKDAVNGLFDLIGLTMQLDVLGLCSAATTSRRRLRFLYWRIISQIQSSGTIKLLAHTFFRGLWINRSNNTNKLSSQNKMDDTPPA